MPGRQILAMPSRRIVLANLDAPPDTSLLDPCGEADTRDAIDRLKRRLLARSAAASDLRRLGNPALGAYRDGSSVLVSEPFNAIPSVVAPASVRVARAAAQAMFDGSAPAKVISVLGVFGEAALEAAVRGGIRMTVVPDSKGFSECSSAVARLVPGVDRWSAPPSGLFVVEERRVLLRSRALAMTAAHEFAHALDAVLAQRPRSYFSYESDEVRASFANATGFVNEYAASGLDEYFAESVRAYLEINDARCAWLPLTRYDLRSRDPRMFAIIEWLFKAGFRAFA